MECGGCSVSLQNRKVNLRREDSRQELCDSTEWCYRSQLIGVVVNSKYHNTTVIRFGQTIIW